MKQATIASVFLVLLATAVFFALRPGDVKRPYSADAGPPPSKTAATANSGKSPAPEVEVQRLDMAKELNATGKTIVEDLRTLDGVFMAWQSNFLKDGNPVGTNAEITAALLGKNKLHLGFLAPDHPAINQQGELCDRWGTPFFFHQLSGTKMEILSAGPDRKRSTPDDVKFAAE